MARIKEAEVLLTAKRYDGAAYICFFGEWSNVENWNPEARYEPNRFRSIRL